MLLTERPLTRRTVGASYRQSDKVLTETVISDKNLLKLNTATKYSDIFFTKTYNSDHRVYEQHDTARISDNEVTATVGDRLLQASPLWTASECRSDGLRLLLVGPEETA